MKITEFLINRYGPLAYDTPVHLNAFNLLWGENENGKTITIDALIKLLLGPNVRDFTRIDRVDEYPSGYVIVESDEGEEVKLPDKGRLTNVADLTISECRNIFIIRNSELMIDGESQFYTEVTDRLTGLRTTEIAGLKKSLLELGKLTPGGSFRNTGIEKIKSRIESAVELCEDIKGLIGRVEQEELDMLEGKILEKDEEIAEIEQQLEFLDQARKRGEYEKGKDALKKLKKAREELEILESFNSDDEHVWQECERVIKGAGSDRDEFARKLEENERLLQEVSKDRKAKERDFQIISERKREIDNTIKPKLENYREEKERLALQETTSKFWNTASITSGVLLGISLITATIGRAVPFYILAGILLLATVITWLFRLRFQMAKAKMAKLFVGVNLALSKYELQSNSINGILTNIQRFEESYTKSNEEIQNMKQDGAVRQDRIKELRDETIPKEERKIEESRDEINSIRKKSGVESLTEYSERLQLKKDCEKSLAEAMSILKSRFGEVGESLAENIAHWEKQINELEDYKDRSKEISYNEDTVNKLKERKVPAEEELNSLRTAIANFRKELEDIEQQTQWILGIEIGHLPCTASVDLPPISSKLQEFVDKNENNRDNVLRVTGVFEEIESEEKEKVSELFGEQSAISEYYRDITGGLYETVLFNQQEKIQVKRRDGKILEASKLSGGAYDQLYLSIRLALGEKLLKGRLGFFIVDDPFIKADPERLRRQLAMLKRICKQGWQVIYFSAKGEVKDALAKDIQKGLVNYYEIQNTFI